MLIEFVIKIPLIQLQFKGLVFFSLSLSVSVSLFHVRHSVNYDDDDDDDDDNDYNDDDDADNDDDDNDDDDADNDDDDNDDDVDGKNSTYESFVTSNSHEFQIIKFHSLFSSHRLFFPWHSNH